MVQEQGMSLPCDGQDLILAWFSPEVRKDDLVYPLSPILLRYLERYIIFRRISRARTRLRREQKQSDF